MTKAAISRKRRRSKLVSRKPRIIKLLDGRPKPYQIDIVDSTGYRSRPGFETEQEARDFYKKIEDEKKSKGGFVAASLNMPMSKLLDEVITQNARKGNTRGSQDSDEGTITRIRKRWGNYKVSFFTDVDGMNELQTWFDELAATEEHDLASGTLRHVGLIDDAERCFSARDPIEGEANIFAVMAIFGSTAAHAPNRSRAALA
jgi:hypothetical protein